MKSKQSKPVSHDYATKQQPNGSWIVYRVNIEGKTRNLLPQLGTTSWTEDQAIKIASESFALGNKVEI